jgi:hypothetical protein
MGCFVNLVKSSFLKKASIELNQARKLILTIPSDSSYTKNQSTSTIVNWSFDKKIKQAEFQNVWKAFKMDELIYAGSEFLVEDYISIVEDEEVSILCSLNKNLVEQSINHYYYVYGDWCYFRTKKKVAQRYIHIALMWKAFPVIPFAVN